LFLDSRSLPLFGTNYFLHQRFETRIASERIEQRTDFNPGGLTLMGGDILLEAANCFLAKFALAKIIAESI